MKLVLSFLIPEMVYFVFVPQFELSMFISFPKSLGGPRFLYENLNSDTSAILNSV